MIQVLEGRPRPCFRRETKSAAASSPAGPRREPSELPNLASSTSSAQARRGDQAACPDPKVEGQRTPAPPPHHDQSDSTGSSRALVAENEISVNQEGFCYRASGSLPNAERAPPTTMTMPRDPLLPKHRSAAPTSPQPAPRSAEAPEFHARTSCLLPLL